MRLEHFVSRAVATLVLLLGTAVIGACAGPGPKPVPAIANSPTRPATVTGADAAADVLTGVILFSAEEGEVLLAASNSELLIQKLANDGGLLALRIDARRVAHWSCVSLTWSCRYELPNGAGYSASSEWCYHTGSADARPLRVLGFDHPLTLSSLPVPPAGGAGRAEIELTLELTDGGKVQRSVDLAWAQLAWDGTRWRIDE